MQSSRLEVVVLVGLPGSGKSTFRSQRFTNTHAIESEALLRDDRRPHRRKRLHVVAALASGMSVVVDSVNATVEERAAIVATARGRAARVVAIFFDSSLPECAARNQRRAATTRVSDLGLLAAAKRLVRPSVAEGFDELWTVRPLPELRFDVREEAAGAAPPNSCADRRAGGSSGG
jgi:predicted kinase